MFSECLNHSQFKHFNPVSAGFMFITINDDEELSCKCYGKSVSLGLNSHEDDTRIANKQFFNQY